MVIELLWVFAFGQVYMPLLGKIWQFAIFLFDNLAPMEDLQRQRLFCFAIVILDMHRIMYAREIFTGMKGYLSFFLVVGKDWFYDIYQFGFKALNLFHAVGIVATDARARGKKKPLILRNKTMDRLSSTASRLAELIELPKQIIAVFHWSLDACYSGAHKHQGKKSTFFFADAVVHFRGLPSVMLEDKGGNLYYNPQRNLLASEWKYLAYKAKQESTKKIQGSDWDRMHAISLSPLPHEDSKLAKYIAALSSDDSLTEFYRLASLQVGALIFTRWKIRGTIRLASAFMFLVTGFLIRFTPSADVMNMIIDHSGPMPVRLVIFGLVFVMSDIIKEYIVVSMQNGDDVQTSHNMLHFARLFSDKTFLYMILSCYVCCNSDVFLTFANLKFGQ